MHSVHAALFTESEILFLAIFRKKEYIAYCPFPEPANAQRLVELLRNEGVSSLLISPTISEFMLRRINKAVDEVHVASETAFFVSKSKEKTLRITHPALLALSKKLKHCVFSSSEDRSVILYINDHPVFAKKAGSFLSMSLFMNEFMQCGNETRLGASNIQNDLRKSKFFRAVNFTVTTWGRDKLLLWLRFPSTDSEELSTRHRMQAVIKNDSANVKGLLIQCKCSYESINAKTENLKRVMLAFFKLQKKFPGRITNECNKNLQRLMKDLQILNKEEINEDMDKELSNLKRMKNSLPYFLSRKAKGLSKKYKRCLSICYFPQIGFVLEIIVTSEDKNAGANGQRAVLSQGVSSKTMLAEGHSEDACAFVLGKNAYLKTPEMYELDHQFGDIDTRIYSRCADIKNNLRAKIKNTDFGEMFGFIAQVDALYSLLEFSQHINGVLPVFSDGRTIKIGAFIESPENPAGSLRMETAWLLSRLKRMQRTTIGRGSIVCSSEGLAEIIILLYAGSALPFKEMVFPLYDDILSIFSSKSFFISNESSPLDTVLKEVIDTSASNALVLIKLDDSIHFVENGENMDEDDFSLFVLALRESITAKTSVISVESKVKMNRIKELVDIVLRKK
ncbi:hypothetical protein ENBRE01_2584 [Enteropsectra breve]|nr:hypothetical protein ENBRE01_2584 [Enteropsectra breve]